MPTLVRPMPTDPPNPDYFELAQYAERFFRRHDKTAWPTVRQAARALGWTYERVRDVVEGDPESKLMLTAYNTEPEQPLGANFVEVH